MLSFALERCLKVPVTLDDSPVRYDCECGQRFDVLFEMQPLGRRWFPCPVCGAPKICPWPPLTLEMDRQCECGRWIHFHLAPRGGPPEWMDEPIREMKPGSRTVSFRKPGEAKCRCGRVHRFPMLVVFWEYPDRERMSGS